MNKENQMTSYEQKQVYKTNISHNLIKAQEKFSSEAMFSQVVNYKTSLLTSISHELKTPLNVVSVLIHILKNNEDFPQDLMDNIILPVFCSIEILSSVVQDITDMAQFEIGEFQLIISKFNIIDLVQQTVLLFIPQSISKRVEIQTNFDHFTHDDDFIFSDMQRVKQILTNLLVNSLKYTKRDGKIEIIVKYNNQTNIVSITVKDTGCGMSEEIINKIVSLQDDFSTNQKQDLRTRGIGIGLSFCQKLLLKLNSFNKGLTIKSQLGVGTEVTFYVENQLKAKKKCFVKRIQLFTDEFMEEWFQQEVEPTIFQKSKISNNSKSSLKKNGQNNRKSSKNSQKQNDKHTNKRISVEEHHELQEQNNNNKDNINNDNINNDNIENDMNTFNSNNSQNSNKLPSQIHKNNKEEGPVSHPNFIGQYNHNNSAKIRRQGKKINKDRVNSFQQNIFVSIKRNTHESDRLNQSQYNDNQSSFYQMSQTQMAQNNTTKNLTNYNVNTNTQLSDKYFMQYSKKTKSQMENKKYSQHTSNNKKKQNTFTHTIQNPLGNSNYVSRITNILKSGNNNINNNNININNINNSNNMYNNLNMSASNSQQVSIKIFPDTATDFNLQENDCLSFETEELNRLPQIMKIDHSPNSFKFRNKRYSFNEYNKINDENVSQYYEDFEFQQNLQQLQQALQPNQTNEYFSNLILQQGARNNKEYQNQFLQYQNNICNQNNVDILESSRSPKQVGVINCLKRSSRQFQISQTTHSYGKSNYNQMKGKLIPNQALYNNNNNSNNQKDIINQNEQQQQNPVDNNNVSNYTRNNQKKPINLKESNQEKENLTKKQVTILSAQKSPDSVESDTSRSIFSSERSPKRYFTMKSIYRNAKKKVNENKNHICDCKDILIVDDDIFNLNALSLILQTRYKISTIQAFNGLEALNFVTNRQQDMQKQCKCSKHFKLIIMDIDMPVMNGIESAKAIYNFYQDNNEISQLPLLCSHTAYQNGDELNQLHQNKIFKAKLDKPFSIQDIDNLIQQIQENQDNE
ncbi:Signal transduction histidine kinase, homodimeric domain [Pseudocohnilembus persalinus]|uniref:Signal transduction histidine kinase, homodimeric domain n=1 Tax=Pseudocohnilembus persalinus TaxID=266149 RepID=A0A0V0QB69_PSEPJ|nr:Signal transduction histidine kinase, homodimeric domain [Pseudocohnilembus persalinus]|eukprot:KRW99403.1 Signal transduction histidine kinase, homodimeric domain [Pseudocohnilembus persalinus]